MKNRPTRIQFQIKLDDMVRVLSGDIEREVLKPGDYLPAESELGEKFGLSRNSVRKGLDLLVAEGLIEKVPKVGSRVKLAAEEEPPKRESESERVLHVGYYSSLDRQAGFDRLLEEYQCQNPQVRIQPVYLPYDHYFDTLERYQQNGLLDVFTMNMNHFLEVPGRETGWMKPLEPGGKESVLREAFVRGEDRLLQPFVYSPVVLCFNREHFAEAGVPEPDGDWTWLDLFQTASRLSDPDKQRYGLYFNPLSDNRWPVFLLQTIGGSPDGAEDAEGKARLEKLLTLLRDLMDDQTVFPGAAADSEKDEESLFLRGKVSMILTTYYSLNAFKQAPFSYDLAPLPQDARPATLVLPIGLGVNRQSPVHEEAEDLVSFLLSAGIQARIRRTSLTIPGREPAAESDWPGEEGKRPSRYYLYREIVSHFRLHTHLGLSAEGMERVRRELPFFLAHLEDASQIYRVWKEARRQTISLS
ncbi:extracellular solute-binding protein [Paenibacillus aurantius]|uniref:Extracellular solute-binding protein n=1 Tax=Paenibacillus aurantius TaxID=2918900 RepID=A0AA96RFT3_9BACL|nr:extracellular solute-binding protein [Paenibacillus aurantius]WNQ12342.1 extracellular solute-binding protein [Paenibacillus aurantius]